MRMTAKNLPPPSSSDFFAPPLQARAGLYATLRGQPGLALQSKKIGITAPFSTRRLTHPEPTRRTKITPASFSLFYASAGLKIGPTPLPDMLLVAIT